MKITPEQLKRNMENFVGKKCRIIGEDHPHKGETGITSRVEIPKGFKMPAMVVKLDSGEECFVFNNTDILFIIATYEVGH